MSLLEVKHVKKVYTTRFMGAKVVALKDTLDRVLIFMWKQDNLWRSWEKAGLVRRLCLIS